MKPLPNSKISIRLLGGAAALALIGNVANAQTYQAPHPLTAEQPAPFAEAIPNTLPQGDSPIPPTVAHSGASALNTPAVPATDSNAATYVTGGVGKVERETLEATANQYNLKVETAYHSGHYISDAYISILDKSGNQVIGTMADGPLFYARLQPGTYTVKANYHDKVFEKNVTVVPTPTTPKRVVFTWDNPNS